ncbi:MAG: ammonium transporter, partial [Beijerinckiaceae bacterium]|nr:ammonium transporter [Beijerinckiaceae bacterium]
LAMVNTFVATAAAGLGWLVVEWLAKGKPTLLGLVSGAVAGLVAVTPASGFAGPMGSIVLGLVAGPVCYFFVSTVKNALKYDDSLDVFGVHCVGGIIGALATGILVNPDLGGVGIPDYVSKPGELAIAPYEFGTAMMAQIKAVLLTLAWSGIGSAILYKIVDLVVGLRVPAEEEREGLDIGEHDERAYNY